MSIEDYNDMNKEDMMRVLEKSLMRRLGEGIANAYVSGEYDEAKRLARVADWLMNGVVPTEEIDAPESWNEQAKETVATIVAAIKRRKPRFVSRAMAKDIEYQEDTE